MSNRDFITLTEASEISGYSTGHLRHLLLDGKLEGGKFGHMWYTTPEALERYQATNPRPGPKSGEET
jgi:hypothetical protein